MHRLYPAQITPTSIMNFGTVFTSIKSNNSKCWLVEVNVHVFVNFILYTRQYQPRVKEPWRVIVTRDTTVMRTSVVSASCNYVGESGLSWTTLTQPWWSLSTVAVKSWEPTARVRLNLGCKIVNRNSSDTYYIQTLGRIQQVAFDYTFKHLSAQYLNFCSFNVPHNLSVFRYKSQLIQVYSC